jgi:hypothetical protein
MFVGLLLLLLPTSCSSVVAAADPTAATNRPMNFATTIWHQRLGENVINVGKRTNSAKDKLFFFKERSKTSSFQPLLERRMTMDSSSYKFVHVT